MRWEMHLPGARVVWVLAPVAFGVLAVLTPLLPARVGPDMVLAPAALLLWAVWVLWAYPEVTDRDGEFVVRNPFRTVRFSASSAVERAGDRPPAWVQTWNLPGFTLTLALVAWAVTATLL